MRHTLRPLALTLPAFALPGFALLGADQRSGRPKFLADDPLQAVPPPNSIENASFPSFSDRYDYCLNTFGDPAHFEQQREPVPARAVNTRGEVPDTDWYSDRHYFW
ncbi:MAG TPA: hypothetical protein VES20_04095, partial [Bryobacteraceae bacterium]|nr:hypothetical protein [Bryobacteraceae bacterium]